MQQTVYKCDNCTQEIGKKKHLSFRFAQNTGIAHPPGTNSNGGYWTTTGNLQGKFMHFCSVKCLSGYFKQLFDGKKK